MQSLFNIYRIQGVLTLLQTMLILGGSLLTRMWLKAFGYPGFVSPNWGFSIFVRNWALLFVLVPVVWCYFSIKLEGNSSWWTQRMTLITGLLLLVLLAWAMLVSIVQAISPVIHTTRFL